MADRPDATLGGGVVFEAFALPPSMSGIETEELTDVARDRVTNVVFRVPRLAAPFVGDLTRKLLDSADALSLRSPREIATVLGRIGRRFSDPADVLRQEALRLLPTTASLSHPMASAVLDGMVADWTAERLVVLVDAEFGARRPSQAGAPAVHRTLHRVPPRLCVQIVSGSVPGVTVNAMLRSLLVGAPTVVKPGRGDAVLPVLFARALAEEDPGLAGSLAVLYWAGGPADRVDELLAAADVVVVYGSDETVKSIRSRVPVTTRVIGYHHRVSVAVIGRDALDEPSIVARELAEAVAMFDQRGCVCPQMVFVEGSAEAVEQFSDELARAFAGVEERLPSVPFTLAEAATLRQWRAGAELWEATGGGRVIDSGPGSPWVVIIEPHLANEREAVEDGPRLAPRGPSSGR